MKSKYITVKLLNRVFHNDLCYNGRDIIEALKEHKIFLNNKLEINNIKEINKGKRFISEYFHDINHTHFLGIYYHAILMCINKGIADDFLTYGTWNTMYAGNLTRIFNILYNEALK